MVTSLAISSASPVPRPRHPLIGRERELAAACDLLLRDGVPLLTLTGPGGVGKTRLALEVASMVTSSFSDGIVYVPLAGIEDPALVTPAVAHALGVRDPAGDESLVLLLTWVLRDKGVLLVLDNFEHLIEAAALVSELLAACPALAVLTTSRQRLNLSVEHELDVPPLATVEDAIAQHTERENPSAAVRLFVARAQAVKSDFALTAENADSVAAICRRLDGLPLAIELAAARVKVLPPVALLARLEQRLPLLTGGARDAPERQRTMRATIAWSYDLLPPEEQRLLRRLAVFAGSFSLPAIDAVAVGLEESGLDALDSVASLIDKSLLRQHETPDDDPRFSMLETVREFALEQLMATGEERAVRERHARWCLNLAEELEPFLFSGRDQAPYLARLDAELDNLRAAIGWFSASLQHTELLKLLVAIRHYLACDLTRGSGQRLASSGSLAME